MIRNFLFKKFNYLRALQQEFNYGHLDLNQGSRLNEVYQEKLDIKNLEKKEEFEFQQKLEKEQDPYEKQLLMIQKRFDNEEIDEIQYDKESLKVNQSRRLRMIIESKDYYDTDIIEFEKLKMKVVLNEENAIENYQKFLINKPYMTKHHEFEENKALKHFINA